MLSKVVNIAATDYSQQQTSLPQLDIVFSALRVEGI